MLTIIKYSLRVKARDGNKIHTEKQTKTTCIFKNWYLSPVFKICIRQVQKATCIFKDWYSSRYLNKSLPLQINWRKIWQLYPDKIPMPKTHFKSMLFSLTNTMSTELNYFFPDVMLYLMSATLKLTNFLKIMLTYLKCCFFPFKRMIYRHVVTWWWGLHIGLTWDR